MISKAVIIVAGGKGLRMGGDIPKQFLPLGGEPVLMHTIRSFLRYDAAMQVVLVLPTDQQDYWRQLCGRHAFGLPHVVADGGETRFHSVSNGLAKVAPDVAVVGVHDGVRPFASVSTISAAYEEALRGGAAVPVVEVVETVRRVDGVQSVTVPRGEYRLVQTPQVFEASLLRQAYRQSYTDFFTDDASVVERFGHPVALVRGNRENIKITTPFDMVVAEALVGRGLS